jgi:NAD(P)-dependent dehydrogenase (short-subunit alcohol dehydrogenase family)
MHYGIDGRSALIVGGSKGIGFEVANQLAGEGARVAVLARTKADVDAAVETSEVMAAPRSASAQTSATRSNSAMRCGR